MNEGRAQLVERAFSSLDKDGNGVITVDDLVGRQYPNASNF